MHIAGPVRSRKAVVVQANLFSRVTRLISSYANNMGAGTRSDLGHVHFALTQRSQQRILPAMHHLLVVQGSWLSTSMQCMVVVVHGATHMGLGALVAQVACPLAVDHV
jgi:hypothetical protein